MNALLLLCLLGQAALPANGRSKVALTFDDLPVHSELPPGTARLDVAKSILGALAAAKAPPTYGFINAKTADSPETKEFLKLWRAAGHPLANHTFSHMDLDTNALDAYRADILANEPVLQDLMGKEDWHWFRYPYLREGNALDKRVAVRSFLEEKGYRIAQVTLDFSDWAYNDPYARCAAKGDQKGIEWLEGSYLRAAKESLVLGPQMAVRLFGRDIKHVMLLHVGAFQIRMLPRLLDLLKESGFDLVTLDEAQADSAYDADPGLPFEGGATLFDQMATAKGLPGMEQEERQIEKISGQCR
jgi:peptidoglycan/xylan/chitin deacetylase (PgdA/CDA1 family)